MSSKKINFQCVYDVPTDYLYVAINLDGMLIGFHNAPVRDTERGEWIDCTDGSCGEIIPYTKWDTSCRPVTELKEHSAPGARKHAEAVKNAEKIRKKPFKKEKK